MSRYLYSILIYISIIVGYAQGNPDYVAVGLAPLQAPQNESSGLAYLDGRIFTHNDSGNGPFLYEVDTISGIVQRQITVLANNVDWEDLAQDGEYLYIADFGNNLGNRQDLTIYKADLADILSKDTVSVAAIHFHYPEQMVFPGAPFQTAYDAESLVAVGDSLYIINKSWNPSLPNYIYSLPKTPGTFPAVLVDSLPFMPLIAAADFDETDSTLYLIGYSPPFNRLHSFSSLSSQQLLLGGAYQQNTITFPGSIQVEGLVKGIGNRLYFSSEYFQNSQGYLSRLAFSHSLHQPTLRDRMATDILVFPNPVSTGSFSLTGIISPDRISVTDVLGRPIPIVVNEQNGFTEVALPDVAEGMYTVVLQKDVASVSLKIQVVHERR